MEKTNKDAIYTTIINCLLLVALVVFLAMAFTINMPDFGFDNEAVHEWYGTGTVTLNGNLEQISALPYSGDGNKGDILTFTTILEKQKDRSNTLMFRSIHQKVKVYLDGDLVLEYGEDIHKLFGKTPGSQWQLIYLPADYDGMELVIESETVYDHYGASQPKIYLGTKSSLLFMIVKQEIGSILIGFTVLLVGFALLAIGLLFESRNASRRLYYLGLFSVLTGIWIILESRVIQLFSHRPLLYLQLVFVVFSLMPIPLIRFLMTSPDMKHSKYMRVLFWVSVCNFGAVHILQITNVLDYLETVFFVHGIFVLLIIGVLVTFINCKIRKCIKDRWIFTASFAFAGFGMIDIVRFYLATDNKDTLLCTKVGIALFILIIGSAGIRQLSRRHARIIEEQAYKRMAYTDMMTGMRNRTAFEAKVEELRTNSGETLIAMIDLNNLKRINDTFGHKAGDEAICKIGQTLKHYFGDKADVYRIGGDEFSVLSNQLTCEETENICDKITKELSEMSKELPYALQAAFGYVLTDDQEIDKAYIAADQIMYQNKKILKGQTDGKTS